MFQARSILERTYDLFRKLAILSCSVIVFKLCDRNWSMFTVKKEGDLLMKISVGLGTRLREKKSDVLSFASQAIFYMLCICTSRERVLTDAKDVRIRNAQCKSEK